MIFDSDERLDRIEDRLDYELAEAETEALRGLRDLSKELAAE